MGNGGDPLSQTIDFVKGMRSLGATQIELTTGRDNYVEVVVSFPDVFAPGRTEQSAEKQVEEQVEEHNMPVAPADEFDTWYGSRPLPTGKV